MFCRFDSQGSTGSTEALLPITLDGNEEDSPVTNGDNEPLIILCTEDSRVPVEQPLEIDRLRRSSIAGPETMVIAVLNENSNHFFFNVGVEQIREVEIPQSDLRLVQSEPELLNTVTTVEKGQSEQSLSLFQRQEEHAFCHYSGTDNGCRQ